MRHQLNNYAFELYKQAVEKGICSDPVELVVETLYHQQVVTYCTGKGCVSFDHSDLEEIYT